jgi:hypothetical protein
MPRAPCGVSNRLSFKALDHLASVLMRIGTGSVNDDSAPGTSNEGVQPAPVIPGCSSSRFLEIHRQVRHTFTVNDRTDDAW